MTSSSEDEGWARLIRTMSDRRINVNVRIDRDVWFWWRKLCQSNSVTLERATEVLIAEKLKELGIEIKRGEFASDKITGPGPMVRE